MQQPAERLYEWAHELIEHIEANVAHLIPGQRRRVRAALISLLREKRYDRFLGASKENLMRCERYWDQEEKRCPAFLEKQRLVQKSLAMDAKRLFAALPEEGEFHTSNISHEDIKSVRHAMKRCIQELDKGLAGNGIKNTVPIPEQQDQDLHNGDSSEEAIAALVETVRRVQQSGHNGQRKKHRRHHKPKKKPQDNTERGIAMRKSEKLRREMEERSRRNMNA